MEGRIVCSKAGRDKGHFLVVVREEDDFLFVCDGKKHPLERPKRKNSKHLSVTNTILSKDSYLTNKSLKKALAVFKDSAAKREEP